MPAIPSARRRRTCVIEVTADGSVHEALEVLAGSMGAELESVLAAASIERGGELLASFLHRHYRPIGSGWSLKRALGQVHLGAPGMTVRRILQEQELAQWLGEEVQGLSASPRWHDEMSPIQRLQAIRELAWSRGDKWAFVPEPAPCLPADPSNPWNDSGYSVGNPQARKAFWDILHTLLWPLYLPLALAWVLLSWSSWQDGWNMTTVIWTLFVAFVLLLSLVLTILALYRRLRHYETRDLADDIVPPAAQVEALMKEENHFAQNHMATVSRLKPSLDTQAGAAGRLRGRRHRPLRRRAGLPGQERRDPRGALDAPARHLAADVLVQLRRHLGVLRRRLHRRRPHRRDRDLEQLPRLPEDRAPVPATAPSSATSW